MSRRRQRLVRDVAAVQRDEATEDEEKEAEYQRLMREELVASRLAAIESVSRTIDPANSKALLDEGFSAGKVALWMVPVALMGLFGIRGIATFDEFKRFRPNDDLGRSVTTMRGSGLTTRCPAGPSARRPSGASPWSCR